MAFNNPKTECPISREEFAKNARPVECQLNGVPTYLEPQEFSTGSLGFRSGEKVKVKIGDKVVTCQANLLLTIVNSKDLPKAGAAA